MKLKIAFLALLCPIFTTQAQIKPLQPGEQVPDMPLVNQVNTPSGSPDRLSAYRGKLLILDFWATSCASCILAMPQLQRLQQAFPTTLQILPVTYEDPGRVNTFLRHNPIGRQLRLPVITADSSLQKLFPHHILSHEVWISPQGQVIAITGPEYVTQQNIRSALAGTLHLPVKTDIIAYDYHQPLFNHKNTASAYSAIGPYRPGIAPRIGNDTDQVNKTVRSYLVNFGLLQLYLHAVGHLLYYPKTLLDIRVADTSRIRLPQGVYRSAWNQRNSRCYESVLPQNLTYGQRLEALRQDLNRFTGLNGRMESRSVHTLSLERISGTPAPLSKGGRSANTLHNPGFRKTLVNSSLDNLIWELNDLAGAPPATDHTGITGGVDLQLQLASFRDTAALNRQLAPSGLVLRDQVQPMEFFVLTDAVPQP